MYQKDPPNSSGTDEATRLWRHLFGGERGFIHVFTGVRKGGQLADTRDANFLYPQAAQPAAEWALKKSQEGREVYFCAHLLTEAKRRKENASDVRTLWGDLDGAEVPNGDLKPTAMVVSSPGRYHVYWRLTDPVPPNVAEALNKRLAGKIGADPSGFDLTQLLRVPGTVNNKHDKPAIVHIETLEGSRRYTPAELDARLPRSNAPDEPDPDDGDEPPVRLEPAAMKRWRGKVVERGEDGQVDRSRSLVQIARALAWAGATERVIADALRNRDAALGFNKYVTRRDGGKAYRALARKVFREFDSERRDTTEEEEPDPSEGKSFGTFTALDLMNETLPEVRWAVPDILPEGVSLLAGKPKMGKSWMSFGVCIAVTTGGVALGTKRVEQGEALYLALEDNRRRLQRRLGKLLGNSDPPAELHMRTDWPRANEGGIDLLDAFLEAHPRCRLVVIDTLARFKPHTNGRRTQYDEDREAVDPLIPIAAERGVSILLVHHLRETESDDPLDMIHGSAGLTGGVDGALVLKRQRGDADAYLHVDGRDIEDPVELALEFDPNAATWAIKGDADDYRRGKLSNAIVKALENSEEPMSPQEVADVLSQKYENVKQRLYQMSKAGEVNLVGRGQYKNL